MKIKSKLNFLFLLLYLAGCPFFAIAHQTGASWEKVVEGYKVDVGYDPTTFVAGQSQRFDFDADDKLDLTAFMC